MNCLRKDRKLLIMSYSHCDSNTTEMKDGLLGKKILITAGPTREYLDPVRFITNESSGKMGYAIAEALHAKGADVRLVSGPVSINSTFPNERILSAVSAKEMYDISKGYFHEVDIAIFSAAVADYRPKVQSDCKIKKAGNTMHVEFIKNPDIASEFGQMKSADQISVGFALETNDVEENGAKKLKSKHFDLVVINSPGKGEGFGYDTNRVSIMSCDGSINHYPMKSKNEVALDIIDQLDCLIFRKSDQGKVFLNKF